MFNFLKKPWSTLKYVVAPISIVIGRALTYAGQALFGVLTFTKYLTNKNNDPAGMYSGIFAIISALGVILPTRGFAIWHHFRRSLHDQREEPATAPIELGRAGVGARVTFNSFSNMALLFNAINSYLSGITLVEFCMQAMDKDAHKEDMEYFTQTTAVLLALCATVTYYIYSLQKAYNRAELAAHHIENCSFPLNKYSAATLAISIVGSVSIPFNNGFTTYCALGTLPYVNQLSNEIKYSIAGVSAAAFTVVQVLTQFAPLYDTLKAQRQPIQYTHTACWEKPLAGGVYTAGVGEIAFTGIACFNGIVKLSAAMFDVDAKNVALIATAVPFALSTALLNFFFSVYEGYQHSIVHYHKKRGEIADNVEVIDLEQGIARDQSIPPIYRGSQSALMLFKPAGLAMPTSGQTNDPPSTATTSSFRSLSALGLVVN